MVYQLKNSPFGEFFSWYTEAARTLGEEPVAALALRVAPAEYPKPSSSLPDTAIILTLELSIDESADSISSYTLLLHRCSYMLGQTKNAAAITSRAIVNMGVISFFSFFIPISLNYLDPVENLLSQ